MKGTCKVCKGENMDLNPYIDSKQYKWCMPCELKVIGKKADDAHT